MVNPRRNKKDISNSPVFVGLSETTVESAAQEAQEANSQTIKIAIEHGKEATFYLQEIKADEIEEKTFVSAENYRDQGFLNEVSLSDILPTIKSHGQLIPAIGYLNDDGGVVVVEGSRRRASCIFAKVNFKIYVSQLTLSQHQAKAISTIGNKHRDISLYEHGKVFDEMLKSNQYSTGKEVAKGEGIDESRVSVARKAWGLPRELIELFPSVNAVGKPTINTLAKIVDSLLEDQLKGLLSSLHTESASLKSQGEESTEKELNAKMLQQINQWIVSNTKEKSTIDNRIKLTNGGFVASTQRGGKMSYVFSDLPKEQKEIINAFMKQLIGD
jgi:ParB family chromosome partitioning protein